MKKAIPLACPECGATFVATHHRQLFCRPAHSKAYNKRNETRGGSAFLCAQVWRAGRTSKDPATKAAAARAFVLFCRAVDAANADDRANSRAHPVAMFQKRDAMGLVDFA